MSLPINAGPEDSFMKRWIFICVVLVVLFGDWAFVGLYVSKGPGDQRQQTKPKPLVVTQPVKWGDMQR